ncbi:S9 family peptidase [Pseudoxanthomonas sp. Root630]|uniref:S9 family peptidase n=1 Tax=Pseudoxanthomonas sp. Root630 TaxID=1736574 RepID=UPI0007037B20|nr:S9 family peptidase [Pseudoxanthomonas sp. Root630]KRA46413.1 peptidase S9 [Pseudoxanthomonas sp. Root630]
MTGFRTWAVAATLLALHIAPAGAEAPVPVEAFAAANRLHSPRLSPDGAHLAITADLGDGHHALVVHRTDDMQRTALLRLPRYELPTQVAWVSDTRLVLAKGRQLGSREAPIPMGDIIATDADGKNQKYLFGYQQSLRTAGIEAGFGYIEGLPATPNGRFYMRRLSRGTQRSQLYDVDASAATARLVADIDVRDLRFTLDRQGVPRFATGVDDNDRPLVFIADAQGKSWTSIASGAAGTVWTPYAFSVDGTQVYGWQSVDGGPSRLVASSPDGREHRVLAQHPLRSVSDIEWGAGPLQPFAAVIDDGRPRAVYFDAQSADAQLHDALSNSFPDHYVAYVDHSRDGNRSLLYAFSDRDPGSWYLFDRAQGKASLLLSSREGLDAARMGERRAFRFRASDGMELEGFMTLPQGVTTPAGLPTVVLPHGGPHAVRDDWAFDQDAQFLASRGYLVLQVNYRGSGGRGRAFEEAGYLKWGTRVQDDLLDGLRWTIAQGYADGNRVCAYGASFGAYASLMLAARAPELIKCTAGLAGVYDLKMMYAKGDIRSTQYGSNYLTRAIGRDEAALVAASPTTLAAQITAPVLLVHGELDERAPIAQARAMQAALERAGRAPEWMAVAGEGHGFHADANNIAFYRRLEAFLARHLGTPAR